MNNPSQHQSIFLSDHMRLFVGKISATLVLFTLLAIASVSVYAGGTVKPLGNKALKKIEANYGKDTRNLFSGKGSERNVLALKRLIAEDVDPDLAITAIQKYEESRKFRSGSALKRKALDIIEQLFSGTSVSSKKGLEIIIGSGSAVAARNHRTELITFHDSKMPSCSSKKTITKRASKVKNEDLDKMAERVILSELNGEAGNNLFAAVQ